MRAKQYTEEEVVALLYASEGRRSPVSGEPGHTLALHVEISRVGDRLMNLVKPQPATDTSLQPIIMGADGKVASRATHVEIWKEINPGMSTNQAKSAFMSRIDNHKKKSGAFWDLAQAATVGKLLLCSSEGQAELAKLDSGAESRVAIELILPTDGTHVWKMRYGQHGTAPQPSVGNAGWDDLYNFSQAFMLVDKLSTGGIHIQTLFPIM